MNIACAFLIQFWKHVLDACMTRSFEIHKDYEDSKNIEHMYCVCVIDTVLEPRARYVHKDYEDSKNMEHIYCVCVIDTVLEPRAGCVHEKFI